MSKQHIVSAVLALLLTAPATLRAQTTTVSVCKDSTTTTVTGQDACAKHGGVNKDATAARNNSPEMQKNATAVTTAGKNTGNAVAKGATDAANATAKGATNAASATATAATATGSAASTAANAVANTAKGATKETLGDVTNTTAAGATAKCKDGTYSHASSHDGACAKHSGVAVWMDGKTS